MAKLPRWLALTAVVAAVGACGDGSAGDSRGGQTTVAEHDVTALLLESAPTPRLELRRYRTRGTYPQVTGGDRDLSAVNAALTAAVRGHQRQTARRLGRDDRESPPPRGVGNSGLYETSIDRSLVSASTAVVSALVPARTLRPGGNGGSVWLAVTVRVPSAERVQLRDLFEEGGVAAVATKVRDQILSTNPCVRESTEQPYSSYRSRLGRLPGDHRHFALTPTGLAVGFANGEVASPSCSRVKTVVPYDAIRPHLSELGEELVAGVREPAR